MSNKHTHDVFEKQLLLERKGIISDPKNVRMSKNETELHVACRYLAAHLLKQADRAVDTEAEVTGTKNRIDVLDYGEPDELPLAVEFQMQITKDVIQSKLKRYVEDGPCRDCLFLNPSESLSSDPKLSEITSWLRRELPSV